MARLFLEATARADIQLLSRSSPTFSPLPAPAMRAIQTINGNDHDDEQRRTTRGENTHRHRRFHRQALSPLPGKGPARDHRNPRHHSLRVWHQHRFCAAETRLSQIAPAVLDHAGGMQGVAGGAGLKKNQRVGFPGAAVFAFADSVTGIPTARPPRDRRAELQRLRNERCFVLQAWRAVPAQSPQSSCHGDRRGALSCVALP